MSLLQICTTPLGQGLPSSATLMFNQQVHSIMPIGKDHDNEQQGKLIDRQCKNNNDALPIFTSIPTGSAVVVQ